MAFCAVSDRYLTLKDVVINRETTSIVINDISMAKFRSCGSSVSRVAGFVYCAQHESEEFLKCLLLSV